MPLDTAELAAPQPRLKPNEKIVRLGKPIRTWVVGMLYGRYGSLCHLHESLSAHLRPQTRIVYLGNYLGTHSQWTGEGKAVIGELIAFRNAVTAIEGFSARDVVFLRGPLEDLAINLTRLPFLKEPAAWAAAAMEHGLDAYLNTYGMPFDDLLEMAGRGPVIANKFAHQWKKQIAARKGHDAFLESLGYAAHTEGPRAVGYVPYGLDPDLPFHLQEKDELCWPELDITELKHYGRYARIVRGMGPPTPKNGRDFVLTLDGHNGLDGGIVHAVCLNSDGQVIESLSF